MQQESNLKNAYYEAYQIVCEKFSRCDMDEICRNSKAIFIAEKNCCRIKYFGNEYDVCCDNGSVSIADGQNEVAITDQVLLLHYLIRADNKPLTGCNISFREIPGGGAIYYPAFQKRAIDPLVKAFASDLKGFSVVGEAMDGMNAKFGSASATIYAFPMIPITYVIWQGDDEVPPSGTILFDESVVHFLPVEDIVLVASIGVYKMIGLREKKEGKSK